MADTSIRRRAPFYEQTTEFVLTPAQIRTLNSVPIDLVVPANATTFLAPGQCVFIGKQGSGAYSADPNPVIQFSDATLGASVSATSWDGSVSAFSVMLEPLGQGFGSGGLAAQDWLSQVGLSLQITSGADVTGGDAPCTIILTYKAYDLTGLV